MQIIKLGDRITISILRYRKWWQLWKPKAYTEIRAYTVIANGTAQYNMAVVTGRDTIGVLHVSGGGIEQIREI